VSSCASKKIVADSQLAPSPLDQSYYENFGNNIARLHQLMLGTFVAYSLSEERWKVSEEDSVVLYSIPIGDITKQGYWIFSYEFMTSLPNNPIYTSIKQVRQIDRDTMEIFYYEVPSKFRLVDILKNNDLIKNIDVKKLVKTNKKTIYVRQSPTHFVGNSDLYEDKELKCLRQNSYDVSPSIYKVSTSFFSTKDKSPLKKENRPNLMLRRLMPDKLLLQIAQKDI